MKRSELEIRSALHQAIKGRLVCEEENVLTDAFAELLTLRRRLEDKTGLYQSIWPCINTTDSDPRPHCVDIVNAVTKYLTEGTDGE